MCLGYDISVRDGSGKEIQTTFAGCLTCAITTYPQGVHPEGYEGGDDASSRLTTETCPRSLWRKNDTCRTSQTTTGNPPGGTP